MQTAKNTTASVKATVANIGASAKAGLYKIKATLQEKVERLTARGPLENEIAELKKKEKIMEAELKKKLAFEQNASMKEAQTTKWVAATGQQPTKRLTTQTPTSLPRYPPGQVIGSHPVGKNNGKGTTPAPGTDGS